MKKLVAGMDLHSNNVVIGIMDVDGQRVARGALAGKDLKTTQIINHLLTPLSGRDWRGSWHPHES
jgi:hypothetical protein